MTKGAGAAFLDLDHTLIDTDSGMRFAHHLVEAQRQRIRTARGAERRRLRREHQARMLEVGAKAAWLLPLYRARLLRRSRLVRESYQFFRGQQVDELRGSIKEFFDGHLKDRVFAGVPRLLEWHRQRGEPTVIVTSAPNTAARLFAEALGVDHAVGVRLEHVDGRLTGRVASGPLWGGDKAEVVRGLCVQHGWDLGVSYGYSDHASDVAFLAAMGRPVAVHPDRRLARVALRRGWRVLDLRDPREVEAVLAGW
jgi:HAD superfamily hydrolase (TIGR01490 family)